MESAQILRVNKYVQMYHKSWSNTTQWGSWENIGNGCKSAPVAGSWGSTQLMVGCTGNDSSVMVKSWTGSAWEPSGRTWDNVGGSMADGSW